ncbi:pilus assembly protein CpaB [Sphingomonas jejuensis]|uniref:Pilus assembly protein CpaB n=1 Tax=Sphingomonas jejuensis TaxID=904715 RepID=A0ABX0XJD8_9SPHN|nr:Flp pilus assembly protein CpaB [Sphingomonas jejuensis]NJC32856.1 pilus assembly protein CpaB [Sphingomonas jejuensis]
MDVKKIALLVGALMIAAVTAVMARSLFAGSATPTAQAAAVPDNAGPEILVATKPLPVGTILEPDSFRYQPWPKDLVQQAYFVKGESDPAQLAGTVVRFAITAGQPVTQGALVRPGDRGFLAAALAPGMRAITVSVSTQTGVAGFVFPGDRIDLMLTQTIAGGGDGPPLQVTETFLRNLRVLATDQRTSGDNAEGRAEVKTFSNVTLEVTPRIAEKITVAQNAGSLTLSLRSIADNASELEAAIASGAVNVPDGSDPAAERRMMASLANAPQEGGSSFTTGGDVSRFQRSTVPARTADAPAPAPAAAPGGGAPAAPRAAGPVIRVARGNDVTEVPVGGR